MITLISLFIIPTISHTHSWFPSSWFSWLTGFSRIQGSGNPATKKIPTPGIKNITISGAGYIVINQCKDQSNCTEILEITADDNILPYLKQTIRGDNLILEVENNISYSATTPIKYHLTIKDINAINSSGSIDIRADRIITTNFTIDSTGSNNININNVDVESLTIKNAGANNINVSAIHSKQVNIIGTGTSKLYLTGTTDQQTIELSGSVEYNADNLHCIYTTIQAAGATNIVLRSTHATIQAAGAVSMLLNVFSTIKGTISGISSVTYNWHYRPKVNIETLGMSSVKALI